MSDQDKQKNTKCGFVSVVGKPNAGKSTLINELVGAKVSIVSRKVQTTRSRILGIVMHENTQILFIDTPGIFTPKKTLERAMVSAALGTIGEADIVIHLIDASNARALEDSEMISDKLKDHKHVILALNKVDQVPKPDLLDLSQALNKQFPYEFTFMISALKNKGLNSMMKIIAQQLPDNPWFYPEDQITDMPMRFVAAELTRERVFDQLHQELPYAIMVETERWENFNDGSIKIEQIIYVERDNQKGIVLGKGGSRIKRIGLETRQELEEMLGVRVHLKLFVKVKQNWQESAENFRLMGLELPSTEEQ